MSAIVNQSTSCYFCSIH